MEINAILAKEITLNARNYEGREEIYELIQSAAEKGLSYIKVLVNGKDESAFLEDMNRKGFLVRRLRIYKYSLYKKPANCIVYNIGWIEDEWPKEES